MLIKCRKLFQSRSLKSIFGLILLLSVFYHEFLVYIIRQYQWCDIKCNYSNCTRILLVADPQIIGETYDLNWYNPFAMFDSDRNLKMTYTTALHFSRPQLVGFLGDLFDEGSTATDEEYERYVNRFYNIIKVKSSRIQMYNGRYDPDEMIFLPGDNDIGGENGDPITNHKIDRFKAAFPANNVIFTENNINFYRLTKDVSYLENYDDVSLSVGLTHHSIVLTPGYHRDLVFRKIKPSIIFSAHMHESVKSSYYSSHGASLHKQYLDGMPYKCDTIKIRNQNHVLEIMVPTCSYRMGVSSVGYGVAVFDGDDLKYTVLWMPNRFIQLFSYVLLLIMYIIFVVFSLLRRLCKKLRRRRKHHTNIDYKQLIIEPNEF